MNADMPTDPCAARSSSERFVDAALSEHARLGRDGADEELILRILQNTVHQRSATKPTLSLQRREWRAAAVALLAAAALLALLVVALSTFTYEGSGARRPGALRVVVKTGAPATELSGNPAAVSGQAQPTRAAHQIEFELATGSLPWKTPVGLSREAIRITADRGIVSPQGYAYEGQVLVELGGFRIEAASVRLSAPGDEVLLADQVRVTSKDPDCVAEAERLSFDPLSGRLVLTGVSRVETDQGLLARFDPADRLVLSGAGFTVERRSLPR